MCIRRSSIVLAGSALGSHLVGRGIFGRGSGFRLGIGGEQRAIGWRHFDEVVLLVSIEAYWQAGTRSQKGVRPVWMSDTHK